MSAFFSEKVSWQLSSPLPREAIAQRKGSGSEMLSYLPSPYVIAKANEIFGFGNWSTEIMSLRQVDKTEYEKPPYKAGEAPKQMVSISYLCDLKLSVGACDSLVEHFGDRVNVYEDVGFGNGVAGNNAYGIGSCIELASKEAVTDALKRCLRYYGNQFGLSLYDKDNAPQSISEIEAATIVTDEQLKTLRDLYPARDIDDEWVLTALKAEHYPHDSLEEARFDWFQLALKITREYKQEEIEREWYERDMVKVLELMEQSANMNMLKALFSEAWNKTKKYDDKGTQLKATEIYNRMKADFEAK